MSKNAILIPIGLVGTLLVIICLGWQGAYKYGQLNSDVEATEIKVKNIEGKVEKVEEKSEDNEDSVNKLAFSIDKYITVQAIRQERMNEILEELKNK